VVGILRQQLQIMEREPLVKVTTAELDFLQQIMGLAVEVVQAQLEEMAQALTAEMAALEQHQALLGRA
jgi:hypothetical protein